MVIQVFEWKYSIYNIFKWTFGKIHFFENCRREFHFCRREIDYLTFASTFFCQREIIRFRKTEFTSQIIFTKEFLPYYCITFSASHLFSVKFEKNSFQFVTNIQFLTKICEKFKFVINSVRDKNSNFFRESVISFHFVNLCLETLRRGCFFETCDTLLVSKCY